MPNWTAARDEFLELVASLRPELHRYCSRLVGSAIDGEDVVQESLAKAFYAIASMPEPPPLRPWLLRLAHNTAIDFLRRYDRRFVEAVADVPDSPVELPPPDLLRCSLASFVALPVSQRSAVILKDVLGCSLEEIAETTGLSIPAVKAALHRGRSALRSAEFEERPSNRALLDRYCALFNQRDWPALAEMLSEETRLDLVSKSSRRGRKQIAPYFGNYAKEETRLRVARVEGREVLLACRPEPLYLITLETEGDAIRLIRDYRYVPYLIDEIHS